MTVCKIPFGSHQRVKAVLSQKKKTHACTVCLKKITGETFSPGEDELLFYRTLYVLVVTIIVSPDGFMTASHYKTLNF